MTRIVRSFSLLGFALLALPSLVSASDVGQRKSGLWEIKTRQAGTPEMTMQICIDAKRDNLAAESTDRNARPQCSKIDSRRTPDGMVITSVCKVDKSTATSRTVVTGDLGSKYKMESSTRFAPPMQGVSEVKMSMSGRWLGPCKPGQTHGSTTMTGLPGGGQYGIDPEMLKQMQKMQQQYGR
jgi:hypothetical protein